MLAVGSVLILDEVDSTQDELRRQHDLGTGVAAVIAAQQTKGRGRQGRAWHSPPGESLSLSAILPEPIREAPWLMGMQAALSVAEQFDLGLIWPNDLILAGRKVGGVLVEMHIAHGRRSVGVLGIGMNLAQTQFPPDIEGRATSLRKEGRSVPTVSEAGLSVLASLRVERPCASWAALSARWALRDETLGKRFTAPDGSEVIASGYGDDGSLIGEREGQQIPIYAADYWGGLQAPTS